MRRLLLSALFAACAARAAAADISIRGVNRVIYGPSLADVFRAPTALARDPARGILVVADTGNHRLVVFDDKGRSRGAMSWTGRGTASGEPRGVALDSRGRLYVVEGLSGELEVATSTGAHLGYLHPQLPAGAESARPQSIAVGASGRIYILYGGERRGIAVLQPNGETARTIGFEAGENGLLSTPVALAVNADESRIAVADPKAPHQVKILASDGTLVTSFGPHGESDGALSIALNVAWGPGDALWVIDGVRHSVDVFTADGRWLGRIGTFGRQPGELFYPIACTLLTPNRIAVLERAGARLQILDLDVPEELHLGPNPVTLRPSGANTLEGGETQ